MVRKKELTAEKTGKKPSGLRKDGTPNAHWQKFINETKRHQELPVHRWSLNQILGYIIDRYTKHMGIPFRFSYSGSPTKSKEIYCMKRMATNLATEDPNILKQYIDWIFDKQIIPNKTPIKSLAYFFTRGLCDKFLYHYSQSQRITRTTPLPPKFVEEANSLGLQLNTYGDLAFAKMAVNNSPEDYSEYINYFDRIKNLGFNEQLLNKIEA